MAGMAGMVGMAALALGSGRADSDRAVSVAGVNKVVGGKKLDFALKSLEDKITRGGVLRVGFLENSKYPEKTNARFLKTVGSKAKPKVVASMPIAQAAFWNEYGTRRAPARPFFRTTIAAKSKSWGEKLALILPAVGYDGEVALKLLGEDMKDDVVQSIATWSSPGNAPLTIKIKGFDKPLVDSGDMQRAVASEVTPK
jgi:hypothetical protein